VQSCHPLLLDAPSPVGADVQMGAEQYNIATIGGGSTSRDQIKLFPGHKLVEKSIRVRPDGSALKDPWQYKGEVSPDGQPTGFGSGKKIDGSHYEGMWKNGMKVGFGVWISKKNQVHKGQWETDKPCGWGTRYHICYRKIIISLILFGTQGCTGQMGVNPRTRASGRRIGELDLDWLSRLIAEL
jgi:hypothetical protein